MFSFPLLLEALLIVLALSGDALVSAFSYGASGIRIPPLSVLVINLICSGTLALSLLLGSLLSGFLPEGSGVFVSVCLLLGLGLLKLFDGAIKAFIRSHGAFEKKIHFSLFSLGFLLKIYADPETADRDGSRVLSPGEATFLALALSLDGLAVGFGAGLGSTAALPVLLLSLLVGTCAVLGGCALGNRLSRKAPFALDWLGGALLLLLAILKLP